MDVVLRIICGAHPGVLALIANTRLAAILATMAAPPVHVRALAVSPVNEESFGEFHARTKTIAEARQKDASHDAVRAVQKSGTVGGWTATVHALRITVLPIGDYDLVSLEGAAEAIRDHLPAAEWVVSVEDGSRVMARRRGMGAKHPTDPEAARKWSQACDHAKKERGSR